MSSSEIHNPEFIISRGFAAIRRAVGAAAVSMATDLQQQFGGEQHVEIRNPESPSAKPAVQLVGSREVRSLQFRRPNLALGVVYPMLRSLQPQLDYPLETVFDEASLHINRRREAFVLLEPDAQSVDELAEEREELLRSIASIGNGDIEQIWKGKPIDMTVAYIGNMAASHVRDDVLSAAYAHLPLPVELQPVVFHPSDV